MRKLPPLASIRVFEAAARHRNFTKAADELGMTQAAVSYQIKLLEERVGMPLFLRLSRNVELTEAGARLAPAVTHALDGLSAAFTALREDDGSLLVVSALHSLASNWLAPRLGSFQLAHPDIAVRLKVSDHMVDFAREEVDVGLRSGSGDWPGLVAHLMMKRRFAPFCSPDFLARAGPINKPVDLLNVALISPNDPWWPIWFAAAGIEAPDLEKRGGLRLDMQQIEGTAAASGQGVALLTPELWRNEIATGRLIQLCDIIGETDGGVWMVYPESKKRSPKVQAFRDWVLAELREMAASETA